MPREQYKRSVFLLNAGSLGWIEGLTIYDASQSSQPASSHYFGGLPYALPPVGQFRFRQARPLPDGFRYGTKASPGRYTHKAATCPQPGFGGAPDQSSWDENCLQLNIYIPAGEPPKKGWPVFFYIHGGFLQFGSPNFDPVSVATLLSETAFKAIIVAPAYRLNALGFLASRELHEEAQKLGEPTGNAGFWDMRLALEYTSKYINIFGGDCDNITVGGYSAGSHSTYQQLAHELYFVPDDKAIIKRVIMWSNSPGVQPKTLAEHQKQFDEFLVALNIPLSVPASEKLNRLREISPRELIFVQDKMKISEFRALTDGAFVSKHIISHINSGDFARRMKSRGIQLLNGECRDEHFVYESWRTPSPSYSAVITRLSADYPEKTVQKLMSYATRNSHSLPRGSKDWQDAFGRLYADMQVHCLERGFINALVKGGLKPGRDIFRYRFNWRASGVDKSFPPEWGVTHGTDVAIWFWGLDCVDGLTEDEKVVLKPWNEAFAAFVRDGNVDWKTHSAKQMVRLREDGVTDVWLDDRWDEGLEMWEAVNGQAATGVWGWVKSKL